MDRRKFLCRSSALAGSFAFMSPFEALGLHMADDRPSKRTAGYGPLVPKGELALPAAFNYQVISRQGLPMRDGNRTPGCYDGMGAFRGHHGTTILIRNHENRIARNPNGVLEIPVVVPEGFAYDDDETMRAGCTKLVVRRDAEGVYTVVDEFAILGGTDNNCAGGVLPSLRWLTCEEVVRRSQTTQKKHGYIFEIDASAEGPVVARPITGAGRLAHEACVWRNGVLYQTEDRRLKPALDGSAPQGGSCLYRYIPADRISRCANLADTTGVLQAAKVKDEFRANMDEGRAIGVPHEVEWVTLDVPDHDDDTDSTGMATRFQAQAKGAAVFDRMEGMWADRGNSKVYFDCTQGGEEYLGQIWQYDARGDTITLLYESTNATRLEGPDNIVVVPKTGDLLLCEDANAPQYVRGLTRTGAIYDFALSLNNDTEFAGACFDPDGHTLYLNQYGERGNLPFGPPGNLGLAEGGVTYAIYGPFEQRMNDRSSSAN